MADSNNERLETEITDDTARKSRKFPVGRALLAVGMLAVIALVVVGVALFSPAKDTKPLAGPTVELALSGSRIPSDAKIGIVVSYGSAQGAQWKDAAQGALVAAHRFELGGNEIAVETRDDRGSAEGAKSAVKDLAEAKVSGILVLTDGPQIPAALTAAREHGLPVILPYYNGSLEQFPDAYRSTASSQAVAKALSESLAPAVNPLLINAGGIALDGFKAGHVKDINVNSSFDTIVKNAKSLSDTERDYPVDAVVLNGPATWQAKLVAELQKAKLDVPVAVTPQATTPVFAKELADSKASISNELSSVGVPSFDDSALQRGIEGQSMSNYLTTVNNMSTDRDLVDLSGDRPFADVAASADSRAHDAFIAMAKAIEKARSTQPQKVSKNLRGLSVEIEDGISQGSLDFAKQEAYTGTVNELRLTDQNLGLRSSSAAVAGQWFAVPVPE